MSGGDPQGGGTARPPARSFSPPPREGRRALLSPDLVEKCVEPTSQGDRNSSSGPVGERSNQVRAWDGEKFVWVWDGEKFVWVDAQSPAVPPKPAKPYMTVADFPLVLLSPRENGYFYRLSGLPSPRENGYFYRLSGYGSINSDAKLEAKMLAQKAAHLADFDRPRASDRKKQ